MFTLAILLAVLGGAFFLFTLMILLGGVTGLAVFGDIIVAVIVIILLFRALFSKKK